MEPTWAWPTHTNTNTTTFNFPRSNEFVGQSHMLLHTTTQANYWKVHHKKTLGIKYGKSLIRSCHQRHTHSCLVAFFISSTMFKCASAPHVTSAALVSSFACNVCFLCDDFKDQLSNVSHPSQLCYFNYLLKGKIQLLHMGCYRDNIPAPWWLSNTEVLSPPHKEVEHKR